MAASPLELEGGSIQMNEDGQLAHEASDAEGHDEQAFSMLESLRPRVERLRAIQSAWGVLAPAGVVQGGQRVAETGRAFSEYLAQLAARGHDPDDATLTDADVRLDELARTVLEVATQTPIAQLRSTLPDCVGRDRRGVLDLLDLFVDEAISNSESVRGRIGTIDYLLTLLCTGGQGKSIRHDPVTLTPSMNALCMGVVDDVRSGEVEAEFYQAANLEGEDVQQEIALRTLRTRKAELGQLFFSPGVLRAIVTYNAAMVERMADQVWDSTDWGNVVEEMVASAAPAASSRSVFEASALPELVGALRRRSAGEAPEANDLDRVAWCLDVDYPSLRERAKMLEDGVGTPSNLEGTTILVGLLLRSLAVLAIELQAIGISADDVSDHWSEELGDALQKESTAQLAAHEYEQACALTDLKSKFLSAPEIDEDLMRRTLASRRPGSPEAKPEPADDERASRRAAREIVRDALQDTKPDSRASSDKREESAAGVGALAQIFSWQRAAASVLALAAMGFLALQLFGGRMLDPDLARVSGEELDRVSIHLARGYRNGQGEGAAFVGKIDRSWLALDPKARAREAEVLVEGLRSRGMNQIMIYDGDERVVIQAVGRQPIRSI